MNGGIQLQQQDQQQLSHTKNPIGCLDQWKKMMSTRPLNALAELFASCNVRFAMLVVLEEGTDLTTTKTDLERTTQRALDSCRLGYLTLSKQKSNNNEKIVWSLIESSDNNNNCKVVVREHTRDNNTLTNDYGSVLDNLVQQETAPAEGPIAVQIFSVNDKSTSQLSEESNMNQNKNLLLYINGNHAMVDGRSMTHLIGLATSMYKPSSEWKTIVLPDWKDMVATATTTIPSPINDTEPPFLLGEHGEVISIRDLGSDRTSKSESFRHDISGETVMIIRQVLKKKALGATLSGFLVAVISHAIAMEYTGSEPKDVGVSMLVDLRPYLQRDYSIEDIPQAHGTVTLMESTKKLKSSNIESLLEASVRFTEQMRTRINRGEAHRAALAVCNGHFDHRAGPTGTIEVSNLGVCKIPHGAKLYTSQRFDGYDGVSFMVHSEGNSSGCMRWNMSVGEGLDAAVIRRIFQRAVNTFQEIEKL